MNATEDLALQARIDERVIHKNRNLQQTMEILHKELEWFDKKHAIMSKDIEYLKKDIGDIKTLMTNFISRADSTYATKDEHKDNRERIEKINKIFLWLVMLVWSIIIGALFKLIVL